MYSRKYGYWNTPLSSVSSVAPDNVAQNGFQTPFVVNTVNSDPVCVSVSYFLYAGDGVSERACLASVAVFYTQPRKPILRPGGE